MGSNFRVWRRPGAMLAKYDCQRVQIYVPIENRWNYLAQQYTSQRLLSSLNAAKHLTHLQHSRVAGHPSPRPLKEHGVNSPLIQPRSPVPSSPYSSILYTSPHPTPVALSHVLWHDFAIDLRPYVRIRLHLDRELNVRCLQEVEYDDESGSIFTRVKCNGDFRHPGHVLQQW